MRVALFCSLLLSFLLSCARFVFSICAFFLCPLLFCFAWFYVWLFSPFPYSSSRSSTPPLVDSQRDGVSYGDVAWSAFGQPGRTAVDFCIVVSQIGFCSAYLIFIIENLNPYYPKMTKGNWLVMLLPICFMMTLIPDLKKLAMVSLVAQVSNIIAFGGVMEFDLAYWHSENVWIRNEFHGSLFFFISIAVYCFEVNNIYKRILIKYICSKREVA